MKKDASKKRCTYFIFLPFIQSIIQAQTTIILFKLFKRSNKYITETILMDAARFQLVMSLIKEK